MFFPILKNSQAKREKKAAFFNAEKLIIDGALYRGKETLDRSINVQHIVHFPPPSLPLKKILSKAPSTHQSFIATFQSRYYIDCFKRLRRTSPSCLKKSNGSPQCICPAVTGCVTATSSHMHFCQEEKIIWHGAP